ncbi:MAG: hypothetical protein KJ718_02375 [Nanoarchaeota archaeon]|nr:hypothetical protein [Nanoarchaeota archaeon]MBU1051377.1 hypothetical protein [Nanoarchaeota archaeon]MBU1988392.1 hypothetical protein [Nanoarchaeota archaeon]
MRNKEKCLVRGMFVLVVALLLVNFVFAEMLVSDANVSYDSAILDALNDSEWVRVIIDVTSSQP